MLKEKQENYKALTLEYAEILDNARKILKGSCTSAASATGKTVPVAVPQRWSLEGNGCNAAVSEQL